jgi:hypothetical protein
LELDIQRSLAMSHEQATSLPSAAVQSAAPSDAHSESPTHLSGRRLLIARGLWLILAIVAVGIFVADLPNRFNLVLTSTVDQATALAQLGLPTNFVAFYFIALDLASIFVFSVIAAVIFARRSDDWMAMFISLALVTYGAIGTFFLYLLGRVQFSENLPIIFVQALGIGSSIIIYYIFPDGRFIPRWTRVLAAIYIAWALIWFIYPPANLLAWPFFLSYLVIILFYGTGVFAQIYRYYRVSGPIERQQTKWVVFGGAATSIGLSGFNAFRLMFASSNPTSLAQLQIDLVWIPYIVFFQLFVPVTFGIAILRYRLWDIDILINRTLVYIPLTAILAGLFAATITLSQKLFVALTSEQSDFATVLTTLVVVAAFTPIKDRLQTLVDKRFKESSDPAQKMNVFGEQVRLRVSPVEAHQITRRLLEESVAAFDATGGAVYLETEGTLKLIHTAGEWKDEAKLSAPLETNGAKLGQIALGARRNGAEYSTKDREALEHIAAVVALAIEQDRKSRL